MLLPILVLGSALGISAARTGPLKLAFAFVTCVGVALLYFSLPGARPNGELRIYSKNIRHDNVQIAAVVEDILQADVDAVMLQEVSNRNDTVLDLLRPAFPHQHLCQTAGTMNVAVASKHPFARAPECSRQRALVLAQIAFDGSDIWVGSVHAPWPWPMRTEPAINQMLAMMSNLKGPAVLAGDFNTVPWSSRMRRILKLTDTKAAGPVRTTLRHAKLPVPLPLDYALSPGGGTVTLRPALGSDHLGIVAELVLRKP